MRGLRAMAAMALVSAGVGGLMSGGAGRARFVPTPRAPGAARDTKTERARKEARRKDPFFGIASRGRHGAQGRAALMAAAYAKTGRRDRDNPAKPARIIPA